jgi:hypothetical protein
MKVGGRTASNAFFQIQIFLLLVLWISDISSLKIDSPDCSSFSGKSPTGRRRVLHIAACDSKWGVDVEDVYNVTSQNLLRNAKLEGNLIITNVCAKLNWKALGFLTKPLKYLDYARKVSKETASSKDEHLIIFSDSDTFWNVDSVEKIFQRFDCARGGKDLVMATESTCWVGRYCTVEDINTFYSKISAPSYSAFVNSGLLMGYPVALENMFSDIIRNNASAFIPKYLGNKKYDDQMAFVQYRHKNPDTVALDYHQHLFGSIVTSHKTSRDHTIPFVCVKPDSPSDEDSYDFNCDDQTSKVLRLGGMRLDPNTCSYNRYPEALKSDPALYEAYRTLSRDPIIWHGNGAGKRTFGHLRNKLPICYTKNYGY